MDGYLSLVDEEFIENIKWDIKEFLSGNISDRILLFPPVNNYRRFLIHKVCENISLDKNLITFSVGQGFNRRTVVCIRSLLLFPLLTICENKEKNIIYKSKSLNNRDTINMGIEKLSETSNSSGSRVDFSKLYRPPALREKLLSENENLTTKPKIIGILQENSPKVQSQEAEITKPETAIHQVNRRLRRERRPDRAVYIPRPRRSLTTSPQHENISSNLSSPIPNLPYETVNEKSNINECSNHLNKDFIIKNNTLEKNSTTVEFNCDKKISDNFVNAKDGTKTKSNNLSNFGCDTSTLNIKNNYEISTNLINNNLNKMNNPEYKGLLDFQRIEEVKSKEIEEDEETKELEKASKEINRTSRRIIKQTFNSDILEIPDNFNIPQKDLNNIKKRNTIDLENDDWETIFDDNGECIDPKIIEEITASVGKVKINTPKLNYTAYHSKQAILNDEEFPHVLEISNFPIEFKTQDLIMVFSQYKESGFDIKWVDDNHALIVLSSSKIAAEVLSNCHPFVHVKPLGEATAESRIKARKCSSFLQPYRARPETCTALARRLVTGALGVKLKTAAQERENEKRVLKEAKERKLLAAKQRNEVWES